LLHHSFANASEVGTWPIPDPVPHPNPNPNPNPIRNPSPNPNPNPNLIRNANPIPTPNQVWHFACTTPRLRSGEALAASAPSPLLLPSAVPTPT